MGEGERDVCEHLPDPETKVLLRWWGFKRYKNGVKRKMFQVCSFKIHVLIHSKLPDIVKDTEVNQNKDLRVHE